MNDIWSIIEECRGAGLLNDDYSLDWDALVARGDFDLFQRYKDLPVSGYDVFLEYLKHIDLKHHVAYMIHFGMGEQALKSIMDPNCTDISGLLIAGLKEMIARREFQEKHPYAKRCETRGRNILNEGTKGSLDDLYEMYKQGEERKESKHVLFEDIIEHEDSRFFEIACADDYENIDWALNNVSETNFDAIGILLDHGARVYRVVHYDDGWDDPRDVIEVDEIATEIMRQEIKKLRRLRK